MDNPSLNQKFAIEGHVTFTTGPGGLPVARISNSHATAVISLYGAHVMSYIPAGQQEVLWMSPLSALEAGKPIRGGIPVCFPWFGPHATDSAKPLHGLARIRDWQVTKTEALEDGSTLFVLSLESNDATRLIWSFDFAAEITVIAGKTLGLTLSYKNTGKEPFSCSDALHTYLNIGNISAIGISGLTGHTYYWGAGNERYRQEDAVLKIVQEENRRYIGHTADALMTDPGFGRNIRVAKRGSGVTVVWNPWVEASKTMGDLPDDGYLTFVCIEAANAYGDSIVLKPGESHSIATVIGVE